MSTLGCVLAEIAQPSEHMRSIRHASDIVAATSGARVRMSITARTGAASQFGRQMTSWPLVLGLMLTEVVDSRGFSIEEALMDDRKQQHKIVGSWSLRSKQARWL